MTERYAGDLLNTSKRKWGGVRHHEVSRHQRDRVAEMWEWSHPMSFKNEVWHFWHDYQ